MAVSRPRARPSHLAIPILALASCLVQRTATVPARPSGAIRGAVRASGEGAPRRRLLAARVEPDATTDRIRLVFDVPVAPSTLRPAAFRVVTRDGRWAVPERAYLDPADRPVAGWSAVLEGDFGTAAHGAPWSVTVVAPLYGQDGSDFRGAGVEVLGPETPVRVRVVACPGAEAVPACPGRPLVLVADGPIVPVRRLPTAADAGGSAAVSASPEGSVAQTPPSPDGTAPGREATGAASGASAVRVVCSDSHTPPDAVLARIVDGRGRPVETEPPPALRCPAPTGPAPGVPAP